MNTMMMNIKGRKTRILSGLLLLLPLVLFLYFIRTGDMGSPHGRQPELQTFQLGNGWGYQIVMNQKVLIYQPTIPAIDTVMPFPNEASAHRIGTLVFERLNANRDFSVTKEEMMEALR